MIEIYNDALGWYSANQDEINFVKDLIYVLGMTTFFVGAWKYLTYLSKKEFLLKTREINENIKFRDTLEPKLCEYVLEKFKNKVSAGIRFVYWKNYPWNLEDDGYKHYLLVDQFDERTLPYGWLDNTGINFQEPIWQFSKSIYCDERGIFFIGKRNQKIKRFKEIPNARLITHLPFSNIINYDFVERIEYEPVFYTRYKYDECKRLYDPTYVCREKIGDPFFRFTLNKRYQIKKYFLPRYLLARAGFFVDHLPQKILAKLAGGHVN